MIIDKKSIFKYTFPLIISGLAEQVLLLTDVFLVSFKGDIYLAAIGLVDAFLLCSLSYGFALNDTFQNYYSRNKNKIHIVKTVYNKTISIFVKYAAIISLGFSVIAYILNALFTNRVYDLFIKNIPILLPLIILNYISMAMNAFLLGLGKIKSVGAISLISIVSNAFSGYLLLFVINIKISPLSIILITSIIAECIAVFMMLGVIRKCSPVTTYNEPVRISLFRTIRNASVYPAVSELSFHIGTFILFLFCADYFEIGQTALLSLILSYWGVLLVPAEAFSETSLNYFSSIYSKKSLAVFPDLLTNIIETSLLTSFVLLLVVLLADFTLYGYNSNKLLLLFIVLLIVFISTYNEIYSTSLIVRLKNNTFATAKIIYASAAVSVILALVFFWKSEPVSILTALLVAQVITYLFLRNKTSALWIKR